MDYYKFVTDPLFFSLLREIDRSIADEAHEEPCEGCAGKLDRGNFLRAGYGMPNDHEDDLLRFSLCCRDCRGRVTPASLRFLRGKAYVTIVIVLLSAIQHGLSPDRVATLRRQLNVSRQTIANWVRWWRERFTTSGFWRAHRGRFRPPFDETKMPLSLLNAFGSLGIAGEQQAEKLLRFLSLFGPD